MIETESNIYVVTEKVTPLSWHVKRKSLSEETIKWGLFTVSSTLKFINEDASSVHGCVRVSAIYTSESGEWKLGGFDVLSSMKEDDAIIYNYGSLVPDSNRYAPPEVLSNGWTAIKRSPLPAADAFGLGVLVYESFNGSFMGSDQLGQPKNIPNGMVQSYRKLINANPKLRLSAGHFLEQGMKTGGFFETPLIRITKGADSLGLKDEAERDEFLRYARHSLLVSKFTDTNSQLDELSDDFPEDFFKMRILPELLKSVEFAGGGPKVFGAIMKIGAKLSDDEYEGRLVPVIVRLFASPDRALRVCLLDNLPLMIDRLPQKEVSGKIFPAIVSGFTDRVPVVREQTVRAVPTLIGKLSERVINGELLRFLAKTANDEQPGIRTNTVICLGKIARNIGASARTKVLLAAFTRSLRDPFVHARNAALTVLNGTIDVYSDDDCATKILPVVCMSLVDKEKVVRDQANRTLDNYLQRVRKYTSTMADTALPPVDGASAANAPAARMGNQNDTSWAGWAISSFTNKVTLARGTMESITNGQARPGQNGSATVSLPPSGRATPTVQVQQAARNKSPTGNGAPTAEETANFDATNDEIDNSFEAWGTMDDDDDTFFDASTSRKRTPSPGPAVAFDDGGEPDFAGWLAAQSRAKAKRALPKGLAKSNSNSRSSASVNVRPGPGDRTISTGSMGSGVGLRKLASNTVKPKVTAPAAKQPEVKTKAPNVTEDDWGDAWD